MSKKYIYPKFTFSLLHPKYWLTWLGFGVLYFFTLLPYPVIYKLGTWLGRKSMRFLKRRVQISRRNLELCFPQMSDEEREQLLIRNFESTGMAVFETGIAWFWSNKRINKWCKIVGTEYIDQAKAKGNGILTIGIHFLTLELGGRIFSQKELGIGVYRPNGNPVMDYIQLRGRMRSSHYMLDRRNVRGMINSLKEGGIIWYAPDHDYGARNSVFVPFFAVEKAATTVGTSILIRQADPALLTFIPMRNRDGSGYTLTIKPPFAGFPLDDETKAAAFINKIVEEEILLAPEQYMWLHRRFKTRPEGEPSLY